MVTEVFIVKDTSDEKCDLRSLFSSSIFNVNEVVVPRPIGLSETKMMTMRDIYEAYQYQWCLARAKTKMLKQDKESNKISGVLVIKSSSITNANSDLIARFINEINGCNDIFDMFYLCRWRDDCQKITDVKEIQSINIKVGRTYSPSGLQAIYFSPTGVDIVLGNIAMKNNHIFNINIPLERKFKQEIAEGNITAWCTISNLFSFDVTKATSNSDYIKTHECGGVSNYCTKKEKDDNSAFYNYLWVIIILIIIIVAVIVVLSVRK